MVVSWFAGHPLVGTGARYTGVVMAGGLLDGLGLPGLFLVARSGLAFALTATAVLTVLLAAVAAALPRVRATGECGGTVPADD